jgi:allophanate hydrolase
VAMGERAMACLARFDPVDPRSRMFPPDAPLGLRDHPVVAHPDPGMLDDLDDGRRRLYERALQRLRARGCELAAIDLAPFLAAGRLLYQGGFVAERYAAVGSWVQEHPTEVDPVVGRIILEAGEIPASRLAADIEALASLARRAQAELARVGADSVILPTVGFHPTIDEVAQDPVGVNARLGRYTTFANLLDLCAVAVPAGVVGGLPFGVSFIGPAWSDLVQAELAKMIEDDPGVRRTSVGQGRPAPPAVPIAVVGAHLEGQPLNHQLTDRGGRKVSVTATDAGYRLFALATEPAKPGLVRVAEGGASIEVEVWHLPPLGFASLVEAVPAPMAIGKVTLSDGAQLPGFVCEPGALAGATDITGHGGWRAYLAEGGAQTGGLQVPG